MKSLLDFLGSERCLIAGAFRRLSDQFGWNRAVTRIVGFFILWGSPYLLGAPIRHAWLLSILIYIGFALIMRKRDGVSRYPDARSNRRWRDRHFCGSANQNNYDEQRTAAPADAPSKDKEEPGTSSVHSPGPSTGNDNIIIREHFGDALSDLEQRLARLDQRIQKMESAVTDRSFDWDRRLRHP